MKKIIYPGWGIPLDLYLPFKPDDILDFGFFTGDDSLSSHNRTKINPTDLNDLFIESMVKDEGNVIIAHSLGSLFALKASTLSDNVKGIVLIGGFAKFTKSGDDYPDGQLESGIKTMTNMLTLSPKMVLNKFYEAMVAPKEFPINPRGKYDASRLKAGLKSLKDIDYRGILKDIDIPVLILHGDSDKIVSMKLAEYLHKYLRNSQLEIFSDSGHALPFTDSDKCNLLIDDFIKTISS